MLDKTEKKIMIAMLTLGADSRLVARQMGVTVAEVASAVERIVRKICPGKEACASYPAVWDPRTEKNTGRENNALRHF